MAKETFFERDKRLLRSQLKRDREELRRLAREMSSAERITETEALQRYSENRHDPNFWRADLQSRLRARGPEKPMALQLAIMDLQLYAQEMEREIAKTISMEVRRNGSHAAPALPDGNA